ncbi:hypothetical protein EWM64_g9147 [Hericium alpestre]|uniref:RRM domain-containing protein n=1 Tax=Hericium alpestre TaxID=135208 RepID=A0A4Y9ZJU8_9AGAM|nr:hypothetical protein EWM64_g9147 [Hericium alpestre]
MASSSTQPNTTLYINNLNDQVNKEELRRQLYALFTTHGKIIDVVATKTPKMRGQAFLVFTDLASATAALRAYDGMEFYEKPMRIQYAKSKSYATLHKEDPNFVPPTAAYGRQPSEQPLKADVGANGQAKRAREDEEMAEGEARNQKREKPVDEEEEEWRSRRKRRRRLQPLMLLLVCHVSYSAIPQVVERPSARLLCTNLPQEVTDNVLSVLFQQYQGFQSTQVVPSPTPNAQCQKTKMAQVFYDTPELASVAKDALDGFTLKKGWQMTVAFI